MRLALLLVVFLPALLPADGGVIVLRKQAGARIFTVFASPAPVRAGMSEDFSVLVQEAANGSPVLDGAVELDFSGAPEESYQLRTTHEAATNKLLFAGRMVFPEAGEWRLAVRYGSAEVSGVLRVEERAPKVWVYWPYFAVVPVAVWLFGLNRWLQRRRGGR